MDREGVLEGEQKYLRNLASSRKPLEDELFSGTFTARVLERGYLTPAELERIASWKAPRVARRVGTWNSSEVIERFTGGAIQHHDDARMSTWLLKHLNYVNTRMATAVLAVLFPDEHTVLDVRAWSALKRLGWEPDLEQVFGDQPVKSDFLNRCSVYEIYLDVCRAKAAEFDVNLRTLDRFLYTRGSASQES